MMADDMEHNQPDSYSTADSGFPGKLDPYPGGPDSLGMSPMDSDKPEGSGEKIDTGFSDMSGNQSPPPGDYQTDTPWPVPDATAANSADDMAPFRQVVGGTLESGAYSGSPGSGVDDGTPPRRYSFRTDDMLGTPIGEGLGSLPDPYNDPHAGSET